MLDSKVTRTPSHGTRALTTIHIGALAAGLLVAWGVTARAADIPITNPGFDTDLTGWTTVAPYAASSSAAATYDSYPNGNMLDLNAPDNTPSEGQGSISQTLGTAWAAGSYELSLAVWEPYFGLTDHLGTPGALDGGVQIQLLDGTTQAVVASTTWSSTDTSLYNIALYATVSPSDSEVGDPIEIVLTHTLNGDVWIDNLDLSSPPDDIPEPGSLSLLAVGLLGVARRYRRKAR